MDLAPFSAHKLSKSTMSVDPSRYFVTFRIDTQLYALLLDHVIRVIRMVASIPIPDTPNWVVGVINMAGKMMPVVDLRILFGQEGKTPELQDLLLILQIKDQEIAVIVDEVLNVLEFTEKEIQAPPSAVAQSRFLSAAIRQEDTLILVLDALRLLPEHGRPMLDRMV